jgi:redox-regulated HSP33 family molecular chaperone
MWLKVLSHRHTPNAAQRAMTRMLLATLLCALGTTQPSAQNVVT